MEPKKYDIKSIVIAILALALIVSILVIAFRKPQVVDNLTQITQLHKENKDLLSKNDSLSVVNDKKDKQIAIINTQVADNDEKLSNLQSEYNKLNHEQNEIPKTVSHLSNNGLANAFSTYLSSKQKGRGSNH